MHPFKDIQENIFCSEAAVSFLPQAQTATLRANIHSNKSCALLTYCPTGIQNSIYLREEIAKSRKHFFTLQCQSLSSVLRREKLFRQKTLTYIIIIPAFETLLLRWLHLCERRGFALNICSTVTGKKLPLALPCTVLAS